jgi:hypothetical protein
MQKEMPPELDEQLALARTVSREEIKTLVPKANGDILVALLDNPNLEEPELALLLERLDLPATALSAVASAGKWTSSEAVRFRLAKHPHTPKRFALAAVRQLYLFDLVRLSLLPAAPPDIRRAAEEMILTRVPHLPVGEKLTLARRAPSRIAGAVLAEGHAQAIKLALDNPFLTESQVLKVLAKAGIPGRVVGAIAQHPKWSCQYNVRAALVRNPQTPAMLVRSFLPDLTLRDLRDISGLKGLAPHLKKHLREELERRSEAAEDSA